MKIGFIGCGNMGGALAGAVSKYCGSDIYLCDFDGEKLRTLCDATGGKAICAKEIFEICDYIFLGVKPAAVPSVLSENAGMLSHNSKSVLISMAAGVKIEKIEKFLPTPHPVIRIMPNTPVAKGLGMTVYCKNDLVSEEQAAEFSAFMEPSGKLDYISEGLIDAACAVSGCGPAFAYMFIEALADGGVECGLPRDKALLYASQMLKGAAEMALSTGKHPGVLKDEVCSPGGSTIEGVHALEEGAFRATSIDAVKAAYEKTKKLG